MTYSTLDCSDATFLLPFSASAWNSAAPFSTLKHKSSTILFNKGHYFNPHDLFRFDATFSASAWNSAVPFTTLIHRSSTILFISGHQNISTHMTCSALVPLFSASAWNSAAPFTNSYTGLVPYLSVGTRIFQPTQSVLMPLL